MALGKRQRKILKGLGLGLAGLLAAWALLPVWFPWVLRPFAQGQGIRYVRYERQGYRRFALRGITFTNQDVTVRAEGVEAWTPGVWLWHYVTGLGNERQQFVR